MITAWAASSSPPDKLEVAKRLIDVCLVSVLLDAGAGNAWMFREPKTDVTIGRSEGLAVASLHAFQRGEFSGNPEDPYRVNAQGLEAFNVEKATAMFQVDIQNPMSGLEGRTNLLIALGSALKSRHDFFGEEGRPGNMIDFLLKESKGAADNVSDRRLHISALFHVLIDGLRTIWPGRASLAGISLGDVWPCHALTRTIPHLVDDRQASTSLSPPPAGLKFSPGAKATEPDGAEIMVPFHKLTQWLTYSLVVPLETTLGWKVEGMEDMTGLPEYRNGGLFVDLGVLKLRRGTVTSFYAKDSISAIPRFPPSHPAIIEWRAMTVILLDRVLLGLRTRLGAPELSLPQVLESATWKGGREVAKRERPETGGPPIDIESDGTVF
ncbi:DUF1688-domain-containing protein [Clavulina sp. PMI_390]|nr:DUF1688-domain-containing protein [Clavulina sp. PMI_390]